MGGITLFPSREGSISPPIPLHRLHPAELPVGTVVGAWRVLSRQTLGGYGAVYLARPAAQQDGAPVALKVALHPSDPRFLREAELLRRGVHPHVPRLWDHGLWEHPAGPFPFLVMDWVEGAGDFVGAPTLTRELLPPGTPYYRSPEALRFHWLHRHVPGAHYEPGPADDVYALGVTAYCLVTNTYPPPVLPPELLASDPSFRPPMREPPEHWVTVCPELAALIRQMLSLEPSARGSAAELEQALEQAFQTAGPRADQPILPVPRSSRGNGVAPQAELPEQAALVRYNLKTVRSYLLKEDFQSFWEYRSVGWAVGFLDEWCARVLRSRLEPMKKVARMLQSHRSLLLNWFRAKGELSSGAVEG